MKTLMKILVFIWTIFAGICSILVIIYSDNSARYFMVFNLVMMIIFIIYIVKTWND